MNDNEKLKRFYLETFMEQRVVQINKEAIRNESSQQRKFTTRFKENTIEAIVAEVATEVVADTAAEEIINFSISRMETGIA